MNDTGRRFIAVSIYAVTMALLEAVVVVYLRALLQINSDHVGLGTYGVMEVWREVSTLVMLATMGWLAGRSGWQRLAYGLFAFGLWDIWYYIWLRVLVGWPDSLLDWDILFLIPLPWWGPVLAPILIAGLICLCAGLAVGRLERGERPGFTPGRLGLIGLGGLLALYVFMADSIRASVAGQPGDVIPRPEPFHWPLFLVALALMAVPALLATWPGPPGKAPGRPEVYPVE